MGKIEKQVTKAIKDYKKSIVNDKDILDFQKSNALYQELVAKGLIKEKGYDVLLPGEKPNKNRSYYYDGEQS